jgi:hypothetical protein
MRRKLGRPRVDSEDVHVRLTRPALDTLDAWIASQPEPRPSRPEAIRPLAYRGARQAGRRQIARVAPAIRRVPTSFGASMRTRKRLA